MHQTVPAALATRVDVKLNSLTGKIPRRGKKVVGPLQTMIIIAAPRLAEILGGPGS